MKKRFVMLSILGSAFAFGQNVKSEDLNYLKLIAPSIINLEKPVDMTVQHLTKSTYVKGLIYDANLQKPYFVSNNSSNPKYVAVVDYIDHPAITSHSKIAINSILIKSDIEAIVYLIESGKGVFAQDTIKLTNNENSNNLNNSREFSSAVSKNLSDAEAAPFFLNGKFPNPAKVKEVDVDQIKRLANIAYNRINSNITTTEEEKKIEFNYLKADKDFDATNFNQAYDLVKSNLKPLNANQLKEAAVIFEKELAQYANNSEKKITKYRVAILENLMRISYLTDDYSKAEDYKKAMEQLDDRSRLANWYVRTEKSYKKRMSENQLGKPFAYSAIPANLLETSTDKLVLEQNNNPDAQKIDDLGMAPNQEYISPVVQLNTVAYQLKALEKPGLLNKYQNDLFNEVLWYMLSYKNRLGNIKGSEKKAMQGFLDFSEAFNRRVAEEKVYLRTDDKAERLAKLREFVSKNYTTQDFTKHASSIFKAVEMASTEKKPIVTTVYQNALKLNGIIQLRDLLADDLYMEDERLKIESALNDAVEEGVTKSFYAKNKTYYEFKKSIEVLKNIKNKRSLSAEEYKNYEALMQNLIAKFIYNV